MGGGSWTSSSWSSYSSATIKGKSTSEIYTSKKVDKDYDPISIKVRESRDSDEHPNSTPIIIALDVTGSMGVVLNKVASKLGNLVQEILDRNPVTDPQIMFCAVGDAMCDNSPFQATQFESDIRIAKQLTELYFEQGGGGNHFESYPLTWYFASRKTEIDSFIKRNKKGFIFSIGDDNYPEKLTKRELKTIFNDDVSEDVNSEAILTEASRMYEIFHLNLKQGGSAFNVKDDKWRDILGERFINVIDYEKIPEIIVSILESMNGKSTEEIVNSWDGTSAVAIKEAINGLSSVRQENSLMEF